MGLLACCVLCGAFLYYLAFLCLEGLAIASPVLATLHYNRLSWAEVTDLLKWHMGLGYTYMICLLFGGSTNNFVTKILRPNSGKTGTDGAELEESARPKGLALVKEILTLLLVGLVNVGFLVTSYLVFSRANPQTEYQYYVSGICGLTVSLAMFLVIPLLVCCACCLACGCCVKMMAGMGDV